MKKQRIVLARYKKRAATKQYKIMRCGECNGILITLGKKENGLIKCSKCDLTWSLERLNLKIEGDEYVKTDEG